MPITNRIPYFDIAKAFLIICLLYSHSTLATHSLDAGDDAIPQLRRVVPFFNAFYMQSFFIITGLCSSYNKDFPLFLWKNIKTLILPAKILGLLFGSLSAVLFYHNWDASIFARLLDFSNTGIPWFIAAMFICRMMYYYLAKLKVGKRWLIICIVYLGGMILNQYDVMPNVLYHRHAFLMLPYLALGQYLKENREVYERYLPLCAYIGIFALSIEWLTTQIDWHCFLKDFGIPSHDDSISFGLTNFPLHIFNCITGTAAVLYVSRLIGKNRFLETIGYGTLFIYLTNGFGICLSMAITMAIYTPQTFSEYFIAHLVVFFLCVLLYFPLVKMFSGTHYLSWMVGK